MDSVSSCNRKIQSKSCRGVKLCNHVVAITRTEEDQRDHEQFVPRSTGRDSFGTFSEYQQSIRRTPSTQQKSHDLPDKCPRGSVLPFSQHRLLSVLFPAPEEKLDGTGGHAQIASLTRVCTI